ncbi:hypothetical protein CBR_g8010 [Chara braunii]|uniref:Uncharacterized protein n=1 Tax=Chara braunii TaxID=69332 RepID=A0A388KKY1_CHABU|nr:hypothetical protein CBR_g8010 [Chara braunii]|eukprot:GBG70711.1 hypothetical protein CBR_g8010 [Chara braunii]
MRSVCTQLEETFTVLVLRLVQVRTKGIHPSFSWFRKHFADRVYTTGGHGYPRSNTAAGLQSTIYVWVRGEVLLESDACFC